ncbi:MAG: M15 family metallopeptidase [Bacteroidales bacterium]
MNTTNYRTYIFLILCSLLLVSCLEKRNQCDKHPNPFGLQITYCIENYVRSVDANPDMELLNLENIIPDIILDIRYATPDNFTGEIIYTEPEAWLRRPAALALVRLQDSLKHHGLGLKIWDAYRPYSASVKFFDIYPDTNFVANPRFGSRHNRGCAVDLTLIELETKEEILMPSKFDEFTERAHPEYNDLPKSIIENREFLFSVMQYFGFTHYPTEWWHFDFNGWENYPLMDLSFEMLSEIKDK